MDSSKTPQCIIYLKYYLKLLSPLYFFIGISKGFILK